MINCENLEIIVITYNRCDFLNYTLSRILCSGFASCKITVLDNCSTDNTAIICKKYLDNYENINIIRHNKNIGASANYLRAVEIASLEYVWILCDDDVYDFEYIEDVCEVINNKSSDLIFVGSWEKISGGGRFFTANHYYDEFEKYFSITLYVPSVIFKTEKFNPSLIRKGYSNVQYMFPHFSFFVESYLDDSRIYVSKRQILYCADDGIHGFSKLDLTISYVVLSEQIVDMFLRKRFIDESVFHNEGLVLLVGRIIAAKAEYGNPLVYHTGASYFSRVLFFVFRIKLLSVRHKLWFFLSAIVSLIPRYLCKIVVNVFSKKIKEKYSKDLPEKINKLRRERMSMKSQKDRYIEQVERMKNT